MFFRQFATYCSIYFAANVNLSRTSVRQKITKIFNFPLFEHCAVARKKWTRWEKWTKQTNFMWSDKRQIHFSSFSLVKYVGLEFTDIFFQVSLHTRFSNTYGLFKFTVIPKRSHLALGNLAKLVIWSILSFNNLPRKRQM